LKRYFLFIEYLGTDFNGWQSQPDLKSVQDEIERVLRIITRENDLKIFGSGRTDAGVHAQAQVAHVDFEHEISSRKLMYQANSLLKKGIAIWDIKEVDQNFHARFAASSRAYEYKLITKPSPLREHTSWLYQAELNFDLLNECAKLLLKVTDYSSFSKENPGNIGSEFCTIQEAFWKKNKEDEYIFYIRSNRFLRHMVRYLVGSMLKVGKGDLTIANFNLALKGLLINYVHHKAPANGLCLSEVNYPESIFIKKN
jgi:tRNA pseudouridine38-40 synthase